MIKICLLGREAHKKLQKKLAGRAAARRSAARSYAADPEKWRQKSRDWRKANPTKWKESDKKYREGVRIERAARERERYLKEREHIREVQRQYTKSVQGKLVHRAKTIKRRAMKANASGNCSAEQLEARIRYYGGKCWVPGCNKPYTAIDHVIPLSQGGSNWPANLRPICTSHNSQKWKYSWRVLVS